MVKRNSNMAKLQSGYLFPEIGRRVSEFKANNPSAKVISLGIGDTTEPVQPFITKSLTDFASGLGTVNGYSGYGAEQGVGDLRASIAKRFYDGLIESDEIFVSDGAKPDTGRLQVMFGSDVSLTVQDPTYPVYVDSSVMMGQTDCYNEQEEKFNGINYIPCTPETDFFPNLADYQCGDIIFICSPNNPTGYVATREQLTECIKFAKKNKSIIIFDAAYSMFIQDPSLPKTIYEIDGAKEVAIEINSFSKYAGFTGVRLGWTVVPKELKFEDGTPVINDFNRITTTLFNGASNIAQHGGLAALSDEGYKELKETVAFYMENAKLLYATLTELGYECYGGTNAPYIWVRIPGRSSWELFDKILKEANIVCTPGSGFGIAGEGFVRFSAFSSRENLLEAINRLKSLKL